MAESTRDDEIQEANDTDKNSSYSETVASWKRIQTNTFVRWVNEHLKRVGGEPVVDLETDFSDGVRLITLVEALTGKKFPRRYNRNPTLRNQKLENVTLALEFLEREEKIRLVNIDSANIVDHNDKLLLGLFWSLILHYSIASNTWEGEADADATVEKKPDLTPKQRLLAWIQNKIPEQEVTNFTSDWHDGRNIGALVESIAPGICPDWHTWEPEEALENAKKAMALAEEHLNVRQLISPDELTDPKVDELSVMTYLAQFPNAKLKSPIRIHRTGACAEGPGIVGVRMEFSVDSLDGEVVSADIKVSDPDGAEKQCDQIRAGDSKSLLFSFLPEMEGKHRISVTAENRQDLPEQILTVDVRGSVFASGPGLRPRGIVPLWKTSFDVHSENMVVEHVDVSIVQPETAGGAILESDVNHVKSTGLWRVEYTPLVEGAHTINVNANGFVIPGSPFSVLVSAEGAERVSVRGRGIQASGVRVGEDALVILEVQDTIQEATDDEVETFSTEIAQQGSSVDVSKLDVSVTDPDGNDVQTDVQYHGQQVQHTYKPEKVGKFTVKTSYGGQNIRGSPFLVNVSPAIERKTRAFGPGLSGGIAGYPACFTVDRHEDETLSGISVDGPLLPVETEVKENEDGSKDVLYFPTVAGEHAVHVFCNDEDIPGSPFMAEIRQATEGFNPTRVMAYGSGLKETGVLVDEWAEFVVDTTLAGEEVNLQIEAFDDEYNVVEVELEPSDTVGLISCRYKPTKPGQHRIFISYAGVSISGGPFRVQVQDNPATYPVVELPVEVALVEQENNQEAEEDGDNDASLELQASQVKAYGEGLHTGFAGHMSSFVVVMSEFSVECLGVAVDGPCKVEMDCLETKEGYKFTYIPRTAGDFVVSINYAGRFPIPGSPFRVIIKEAKNLYSIRVYTGNKLFAGTDANVFITLYGEIGDTGTIQLKYSRTHLNKFERNQMDEFFVEVFNIGDLKKLKIGHDNRGKVGASWFLDRVEIESPLLCKQWTFPFRRWLSKGDLAVEMVAIEDTERRIVEGSGQVDDEEVTESAVSTVSRENSVEAEPNSEPSRADLSDTPGAYYIYVYTGNKLFGGTDANVYIQLFGDNDESGVLELKSSKTNRNKFERNQKDEFVFDIQDVGNLEKIRIGHDNGGLFGSSWFLDRVEVESTLLSKRWKFPFNQWLSKEKKGCSLEAEIYAQEIVKEGQTELGDQDSDSIIDLTDADVKASGPGLEKELSVNVPTSFCVDVSEAEPGNLLLLSVQGPSEPCGVNMTYEGEGIYNVSFHPREKGVHVITIKWGKRYITGSPFIVTVD